MRPRSNLLKGVLAPKSAAASNAAITPRVRSSVFIECSMLNAAAGIFSYQAALLPAGIARKSGEIAGNAGSGRAES
jgi:hypothetical protein